MSNPVFWKKKKTGASLLSAELAQGVVKVKINQTVLLGLF